MNGKADLGEMKRLAYGRSVPQKRLRGLALLHDRIATEAY